MNVHRARSRTARRKETKLALLLALGVAAFAGVLVWSGAPAALLAILFFAVGIARPEWGLFALVFALFTNLFGVLAEHHELPGATVNLLVLALGLSVLFRWALRDMPPVDVRRPLMVLIAYGVLGSASLLYARHTGPVAVEVDLYVKSVALGVVAVLLMDGIRSLRVVAWALLSGAILVGTIGVYKYCMGAFDDTFAGFGRALYAHISKGARGWRLSGPMGDPNYFGALLVFVVPLAVERLLHERDKPMRLCAGWALFVSLLCIYFTASRGALVALALVMVSGALIYRRHRLHLALAGMGLVVVILAASPVAYIARLESMLGVIPGVESATPPDGSIQGRLGMWRIAWALFVDHPLFGVGWGNYDLYYQEYAGLLGLTHQAGDQPAHSLYLEIAAELGLLGLAAFACLLFVAGTSLVHTVLRLHRADRPEDAALVAAFGISLLGYLATRLFLHESYAQFLWLALILALATSPLITRSERAMRVRSHAARRARAHGGRGTEPNCMPDLDPAAGAMGVHGEAASRPAAAAPGRSVLLQLPTGAVGPALGEFASGSGFETRVPIVGQTPNPSALAAAAEPEDTFPARLASRLSASHRPTMRRQPPVAEVGRRIGEKQSLMIFGCQCSGASLAAKFFWVDGGAECYDERGGSSDGKSGSSLRLNSAEAVKQVVDGSQSALVVLQLQRESQHADALLGALTPSHALWLYRHYRDFAASHLRRFGPQGAVRDLHATLAGQTDDWRAEQVPDDALALLRQHYSEDMGPGDAAALFWFVRNSHFFRLKLDRDPRVMLSNYDALRADPLREIAIVYDFLAREPPSRVALATVQRPAPSRHSAVALTPGVEEVCRELWRALQEASERRH